MNPRYFADKLRLSSCATIHGSKPCHCSPHPRPPLFCERCRAWHEHSLSGVSAGKGHDFAAGAQWMFKCSNCRTDRRFGFDAIPGVA